MLRYHHLIILVSCLLSYLQAASPDIKHKETLSAYFNNVRSDWALFVFSKSGKGIEETAPISYVFWGLGPKDTEYEKVPAIVQKNPQHSAGLQESGITVQPAKALDPDKIWMLRLESPDGNEKNLLYTLEGWYPQLITPFTAQVKASVYSKSRDIQIYWNIPILSKEEARIFRDYIHFESNGVLAQNAPDGTSKTLNIKGKELTFKLDTKKSIKIITEEQEQNDHSMNILIEGAPIFEGNIILQAGIPAQDGQKLKNKLSLPIRVGINNPHLWYLGADYLPLHDTTEYPFFTSYLSSAKISLQKISHKEAPMFFLSWQEASKKQFESWKSIKQALPNANPDELNEWRSFIHRPFNTKDVKSEASYNYQWKPASHSELKNIQLSELCKTKTLAPGLYFMDILGAPDDLAKAEIKRNGYPKDDLHIVPLGGGAIVGSQKIIQITDIGCIWKQSSKKVFFYCYSLKTGTPIRHTVLRFFDAAGELLQEYKCSDGTATLEPPKKATLLMFSHGNDQCLLSFPGALTSNAPRYIESINSPAPFPIKRKIAFISNRDKLHEDGIFRLKAIMRGNKDGQLQLMPEEKCYLHIQDSSGKIFKSEEIKWDQYGTLDIAFPLPPKINIIAKWWENEIPSSEPQENTGEYTLSLYFPRNNTAHKLEDDSPVPQTETPFTTDLEYYERAQRHFELNFRTPRAELKLKKTESTPSAENTPRPNTSPEENRLDISPDKPLYTVGEKAKIQFAEPISGPVLLSVERDHILTHKVLTLETQTKSLEIPILASYFPNAYISIAKIQHDQNQPKLQLDISEIRVNKLEKSLFIELKAPITSTDGRRTSMEGCVMNHQGEPVQDILLIIRIEVTNKDNHPQKKKKHTIEQDFYPSQIHRIRTGSTLHLMESRLQNFKLKENNERDEEYIPYINETTQEQKKSPLMAYKTLDCQKDNLWINDIHTNNEGLFSFSWHSHLDQNFLIHITAISIGDQIGSITKKITSTQDQTNPPIQTTTAQP